MSPETTHQQLTLFVEAFPVKTYPLPESARAWLETDLDFGLSSIAFLRSCAPSGLLSKTSPACYPVTEGETLPSSFEGWSNAGMASVGGYLTLSISEWPSAAVVCSLSEVLETDVPLKYFLSATACRGILRRAERRNKKLPPLLEQILQAIAMEEAPHPPTP